METTASMNRLTWIHQDILRTGEGVLFLLHNGVHRPLHSALEKQGQALFREAEPPRRNVKSRDLIP